MKHIDTWIVNYKCGADDKERWPNKSSELFMCEIFFK